METNRDELPRFNEKILEVRFPASVVDLEDPKIRRKFIDAGFDMADNLTRCYDHINGEIVFTQIREPKPLAVQAAEDMAQYANLSEPELQAIEKAEMEQAVWDRLSGYEE